MKLINIPRAGGKTQYLINKAARTGKPILVATISQKKNLIYNIKSLNIDPESVEIITVREILTNSIGRKYTIPTVEIMKRDYLVDELPLVFEEMMRILTQSTIDTATLTVPMTENLYEV